MGQPQRKELDEIMMLKAAARQAAGSSATGIVHGVIVRRVRQFDRYSIPCSRHCVASGNPLVVVVHSLESFSLALTQSVTHGGLLRERHIQKTPIFSVCGNRYSDAYV